ncbi:MAG: cytochrome P460, partial [Terriglobales bacterium]
MRILTLVCLFLLQQYATTPSTAPAANKGSSTQTPTYTADGRLMFPANYREWIFLSSGVDMSYLPNAMQMKHSMFDN